MSFIHIVYHSTLNRPKIIATLKKKANFIKYIILHQTRTNGIMIIQKAFYWLEMYGNLYEPNLITNKIKFRDQIFFFFFNF